MYVTEEELYGEQYAVYVGKQEVTEAHLSKSQANHLKEIYLENGYANVKVERIEDLA